MTEPSTLSARPASSVLSRRRLLTAGGATVLGGSAVILTACSPFTAGANTPAPRAPETGTSSAGGLAVGTVVGKLSSIPVGGTASAAIDHQPVLLAQPSAGHVVAYSAVCPHQGCVVAATGTEFDCPCHGSRFDAATGAVLMGPAPRGLTTIAVTISGTNVVTS